MKQDQRNQAGFWAAESYLRAKQYAQALPLYQDFLAKLPKDPNAGAAAIGAAQCQQQAGKWDEAIAFYNQAIQIEKTGTTAKANCGIGECFLAENKPADALTSFAQAVAMADDPTIRDRAWLGTGQALEAQQKWDGAVTAYQNVIDSKTAGPLADTAKQRQDAIKQAHPAANTR